MSRGISFSSNAQTISAPSNYPGPNAYEKILPFALDDVCIEYSRAANVDKVYGYNAINNMLVNIIYTRIGERDFEPEFGSNVIDLLMEPNDENNATVVEIEIFDRVRYWVPYIDITLQGIICEPIPQYQSFRIAFIYKERATGIQRTFTAFISRSSFI